MRFTPCKDCPDRTIEPNCHSTCEKFAAFTEEKERIKNNRILEETVLREDRFSDAIGRK